MFRTIAGLLVLMVCSLPAFAQAAKGVDKQNERVRDSGSERTPANNGNKTDTGTGRGFDFGKGRTPETPPLPNPYRLSGRRDVMITAVQDLMRDRKMVLRGRIKTVGRNHRQPTFHVYEGRCRFASGTEPVRRRSDFSSSRLDAGPLHVDCRDSSD